MLCKIVAQKFAIHNYSQFRTWYIGLCMQAICYILCTVKEDTYDDVSTKNLQTLQLQMKAATVDKTNAYDRDVDNPLYTEPDGKDSATIELKNGNQMQSSSKLFWI